MGTGFRGGGGGWELLACVKRTFKHPAALMDLETCFESWDHLGKPVHFSGPQFPTSETDVNSNINSNDCCLEACYKDQIEALKTLTNWSGLLSWPGRAELGLPPWCVHRAQQTPGTPQMRVDLQNRGFQGAQA